jgi:hypothetical protein
MFESNFDQKRQMLENIRNILAIDDISITNVKEKTKEPDEHSTADSSITTTNFTGKKLLFFEFYDFLHFGYFSVVTFNDFNRKPKSKKAICRRSHQVTIVIIVMSFLFLIGISGLVCMIEMRFQKMPR